MATTLNLEQVIWQNLRGLSTESLKEITAFIIFVRKKIPFLDKTTLKISSVVLL
jgi:hypothetical protein